MKKLYSILILGGLMLSCHMAAAQFVFNDTILVFDIIKTRVNTGTGDARYLIDFQTQQGLTGKIVMGMCGCYCDSLWDAWPPPGDDVISGGGAATLTVMASGSPNNPQLPSLGDGAQQGRLNIWKMPGAKGILRQDPFTVPVRYVVTP